MAETYRTHLKDYADKYKSFLQFRRADGILEARFHSADGTAPLKWTVEVHHGITHAMFDINNDPDNECLILTGTGASFLSELDHDNWRAHGFYRPFGETQTYDVFYREQTREPFAILNLQIPVIAAVNGPIVIHPELMLLNDIVLCSENTYFSEGHWSGLGIVPGDGVQTLFRELLGPNRGRYFLLMGQKIDAREALQLGLVGEVVPSDQLLDRAWDIARKTFMSRNRIQRRLTRAVLTQHWRELFMKELAGGMAHQTLASLHHWPMAQDDGLDEKLAKR